MINMRYLYENSPERYAQDVVYSVNLTPPVDIYSVCDSYDIKVCFEDISTAEAFLVVTSRRKSIIINERKYYIHLDKDLLLLMKLVISLFPGIAANVHATK